MTVQQTNTEAYAQLVAHHYDEEATGYDGVYTSPIQKAEDAVVMGLIAPYVTGDQRVLDVGCGTGLPLSYLRIASYHGIDVSPGMIEQAQKDHPESVFEVGDMHQLPIDDESVDTVISLFGPLSYSFSPETVVSELYRVLAPGGTAIVMPYTQRVQYGLEMGGYSTASAGEIPKTFYDRSTLVRLFGGFCAVKAFGINYYGNTLQRFGLKMGDELGQVELQKQLLHEVEHADAMPDLKYARHAMVVAHKPVKSA